MYGDRLILAETLISVLETGSFSETAVKLGVSQSTVSRRIAALEQKLGSTPLFHRGTRWIDATQEAEVYAQDIRNIFGQLEAAEAKVRDKDQEPSGLLRISLPPALGRTKLAAPLGALPQRYPRITLKISLSEDYVDLRDGTIDLAVRIKSIEQTGIAVEKIGESKLGLYASPDYLKTASPLRSITDLSNHNIIGLTSFFEGDVLNLPRQKRKEFADLRPTVLLDDVTAIYEMVKGGYGVGFMPDYLIGDDLKTKKMVLCTDQLGVPAMEIFALFPHGLRKTPRLLAALGTLRQSI